MIKKIKAKYIKYFIHNPGISKSRVYYYSSDSYSYLFFYMVKYIYI